MNKSKSNLAARACTMPRRKTKRISSLIVTFMLADLMLTGMTWNGGDAAAELTVDGATLQLRASGETIAAVLEREGIILGEHDEMNFSPDDRVSAGMNIIIDRVEYIEKTTSSPIPYETVQSFTTLEKRGYSSVAVSGEAGRRDTTVIEKLVNGQLVSVVTESVSVIPPVNEEIIHGSALNEPYSRKEGSFTLENGVPSEYERVLCGKVTAYTAPEGCGTYSGRPLEIGTVGVDPNVIPFGSELYICSKDGEFVYGYAIAADTGCFDDVIADVFMGTTSEHLADACRWGAQEAYVYVLKEGDNSVYWG